MRRRLGFHSGIETIDYGKTLMLNGVKVSLHPAGHVLGSAQVRLEYRGEVWVVSGDYKLDPDPTCSPFESVPCATFVTESTFGQPIYRWPAPNRVFEEINGWWRSNSSEGKPSLLYAYSLGKAQRVLAGLDPQIGEIYTHESVESINRDYRDSGVALPKTRSVRNAPKTTEWGSAIVLAPPAVRTSTWPRRFSRAVTAFASGWMVLPGAAERQAVDRGFTLSDHADWPGLLTAIQSTGAKQIWIVHGEGKSLAQELRRRGLEARQIDLREQGN